MDKLLFRGNEIGKTRFDGSSLPASTALVKTYIL